MKDWFAQCRTLAEARDVYRRLCFEYHPDCGGDTLVMQAINVAYERFKLEQTAPHLIRSTPRSAWERPPRQRPTDVPPTYNAPPPPEPQPLHSRESLQSVWNHVPWQTLTNGGLMRQVWNHAVALVQHPAPKYAGAWIVVLDETINPIVFETRTEAEQAAFDLLYDKVKYCEL